MTKIHTGATLIGIALALIPAPSVVPAQADTGCGPSNVRLTSVHADSTNGTVTGAPVGGGSPVTLQGALSAYQKSAGFGDTPPPAVQRWDETIDSANTPIPPDDPNWYGRGKGIAFATRQLNGLAAELPAGTLAVQYSGTGSSPGWCTLTSIQPVAP